MTYIVTSIQACEPDELAEADGITVTIEPELDSMGFNTVTIEGPTRDAVLDYVRDQWGSDDNDWMKEWVADRVEFWPSVGERLRLTEEVWRYPHFKAPKGATGTVVAADYDLIRVRLDETIPGAEDWDNEIHWSPANGDQIIHDVEAAR